MSNKENNLIAFGFNAGYWIKSYLPKLYTTLENGIETKNEFFESFVSGGKERMKEMNLEDMQNSRKTSDKDFDR